MLLLFCGVGLYWLLKFLVGLLRFVALLCSNLRIVVFIWLVFGSYLLILLGWAVVAWV